MLHYTGLVFIYQCHKAQGLNWWVALPNLNGTTSSHEIILQNSDLNDVTSFPLVVYHFRFLTPTRVVSYY